MDDGQSLALSRADRGRNLMNAQRWQQVNDLFHLAVERAPEERAAFCGRFMRLMRLIQSSIVPPKRSYPQTPARREKRAAH